MKTLALFSCVLLVAHALNSSGANPEGASDYSISERGANHRVWAQVTYETNKAGKVIGRTNSAYTELETSMHYFDNGEWKESSTVIEIAQDGAVASKTPHKVSFDGNVNVAGAVELLTPDGKNLKSHILGLSYFDTASGKSVLIAELQDADGFLLPSKNKIIYQNAFTDVKADVLYTLTKAGLEQDIILREQPPSPSEWGLDPATTRLQVLTEFLDPPEPVKEQVVVDGQVGLTDEKLDFGEMKIGRGKAFAIGAEANQKSSVPVVKQWTVLDGRKFLVEEVQYKRIESTLKTLPEKPQAALPDTKKFQNLASIERKLPALPTGTSDKPIELAQLDIYGQPGFVLDYSALASSTDFTFQGDTTYFCSGDVNLDGTSTIEGGTVVKFGRSPENTSGDPAGTISFNGPIDCQTTAYRPAIFTAMDDDTVGERISGSCGTPNGYFGSTGYYGGNGNEFHGSACDVLRVSENLTDLRHLRVNYLVSAFRFPDSGDIYLRNVQLLNCYIGMKGGANLHVQNGLFTNIVTLFWCGGCNEEEGPNNGTPVNIHGEHLTIDSCANFGFGTTANQISLANSLLLGVPDQTQCTLTTDHTEEVDGSAFQSVGAGNYYLADGTYRDAGTTDISPWLLAELETKTTYPPIILTNAIMINTTLNPQAQRDTDAPDLGYHYDPLDYVMSGVALTNATLTLTNGVAIGVYGTNGIQLRKGGKIYSEGTPINLNRFVRYQAVQEQSSVWGTTGSTMSVIQMMDFFSYTEVRMRFTDISLLSDAYHKRYFVHNNLLGFKAIALRDCFWRGGFMDLGISNPFCFGCQLATVSFTNCLVQRVNFKVTQGHSLFPMPGEDQTPLQTLLYNNLFLGGTVSLEDNTANAAWYVFDNLFDTVNLSNDGSEPWPNDYNGYHSTTQLPGSGGHDVTVANADYQSGALGSYYYPTTGGNLSLLIDAGSRYATNAALYHYTTTADQVKEVPTSTVDIGFHYVAVNGSDQPVDTDGDGLPDYFEDANGDGNGANDPTSWQVYNSPNGLAAGTGLQVFTPLK